MTYKDSPGIRVVPHEGDHVLNGEGAAAAPIDARQQAKPKLPSIRRGMRLRRARERHLGLARFAAWKARPATVLANKQDRKFEDEFLAAYLVEREKEIDELRKEGFSKEVLWQKITEADQGRPGWKCDHLWGQHLW